MEGEAKANVPALFRPDPGDSEWTRRLCALVIRIVKSHIESAAEAQATAPL